MNLFVTLHGKLVTFHEYFEPIMKRWFSRSTRSSENGKLEVSFSIRFAGRDTAQLMILGKMPKQSIARNSSVHSRCDWNTLSWFQKSNKDSGGLDDEEPSPSRKSAGRGRKKGKGKKKNAENVDPRQKKEIATGQDGEPRQRVS
ncbi:unnamed protein product [Nesidiocoris tenuis]|uniref:Uncharacterized protein n=1 Tax=Nesidiocoris tenuis TaxID=355587 RepID=A0A6H5H3Q2_9HEMI|nr:unnamed protein product [Nesidiocoris tenuis]